jgi:YVTN family beta-propeller protein
MVLSGTELYVACQQSGTLAVIDITKRKMMALVPVGGFPYGVAVRNDKIFVSDWSQAHLSVVSKVAGKFLPTNEVPLGRHPSAMALASDGLLYVAHGNDDSVGVVNTNVVPPKHFRTIKLQPYTRAPRSSIPTDVTLSPDERTLYVTLGGNNAVAVIDLDALPTQPSDLRYVPTGWFPTSVLADDDAIYVTSGKGLGSGPNGAPTDPGVTTQIFGTLQVVEDPDNPAYTPIVRADNRFDHDQIAAIPEGNAMYDHARNRSKVIDNVILVVRENKTFDQVMGDVGDPDAKDLDGDPLYRPDVRAEPLLTRYGVANTPNTHALAEEFVTADEFRAPIEESFTGHQWLNHGQLSDHAARIWTTEGRNVAIGVDDASAPGEGNLLDRSEEAGITYKTYGWDGLQVSADPKNLKQFAANSNNAYPTGLQYYTRDVDRIQALLTDMKLGQLPRFSYVWIPNDHTYDMQAGARTPQSMVADNDWAVGKIVEGLTKSKYWNRTAVFFVEDDPQSGRDHIDSHRTVFLAASPWIKRNNLSHERYDFSSLHRTVELILGLKPTSQVEEKAATPLTELFRDVADGPVTTGYEAIEPAVSPNNLNPPLDQLDPVLKPFWELAQTVDRSNVDTDEEKVMEILDGMYHHGAWTYGAGLAPKPTKQVLSLERTHPPVEELIEEAEEDDDGTVLGVALKGEERSTGAKWLVLPLLALGLLALRRSTRTHRP